MRMEDLRYLIQVADCGSISQAAENCYITQQGLSRIISSLERELGVKLFDRSGSRIVLTALGEEVVSRARELDALYQRMLLDISRSSRALEGAPPVDLHIYTSQLISATLLPRVLSAFNLRYPGINLNIIELNPPEIADKVDFTENSIAITSMSTFHQAQSLRLTSGELVFERYFSDELMLGVAEHSPLAKRTFISAEELATIPLALCNTESMMARNLLPPDLEPTVALHTSSYDLCREMVARNRAACLSSALREHYSKYPIVAVPLAPTITVSYGVIYDPLVSRPPMVEDIFSMVRSELSHVASTPSSQKDR